MTHIARPPPPPHNPCTHTHTNSRPHIHYPATNALSYARTPQNQVRNPSTRVNSFSHDNSIDDEFERNPRLLYSTSRTPHRNRGRLRPTHSCTLGHAHSRHHANAIATANNNTAVATAQVAWVEEAFGLGIGGHNTYWMWLCYSLDAAVYPVFAAE